MVMVLVLVLRSLRRPRRARGYHEHSEIRPCYEQSIREVFLQVDVEDRRVRDQSEAAALIHAL
jgi:hypothetical protein